MTDGQKMALAIAGGVAVLGTAVGVAIAVNRRQGSGLGRHQLGYASTPSATRKSMPKKNGMTLTMYSAKGNIPIEERLGIIQDLIHESVKQPDMRDLALKVTRNCPARDGQCESRAIYDWVRRNIRYTGDIAPHLHGRNGAYEPIDLFQRADRTVQFGGGDCDDHTILVSSLAILNGIQARARVTSRKAGPQDDYTHIYPMLGLPKMNPGSWVAADTTLPGNYYGVEAPHVKRLDFAA